MAARYDFREVWDLQEANGKKILYPRMVFKGTVSWKKLVEEVARDSGFTPGMIVGMMQEVERRALWHMEEGFRVQVGDMCYVEPTVEMVDADRRVENESDVHARSLRFGKVNIQPQKSFRPQGQLERAEPARKFGHSSTRTTADERYGLLKAYLAEHAVITRTQYSELTGLLRSNAQRELNRWIAEGRLGFEGRAPHRVYKIKEQ